VPWPAHLSDREVEVLRLVAIGRTNPEIGRLLGISAKTVQHHVSHVFDKLGVASRAGAALAAVELGLLR
ncbi:MAG: helix-turn-helix transcriptional regulator, partial [Myxococcales bacterium]|nr:helix-turn-helix transcriptional regulator [Myxococcales bacterium]